MKRPFRFILTTALLLLVCYTLPTSAGSRKTTIRMPTADTSGFLYPFAKGLAELWNEKLLTVNAVVLPSNGGIQNLNLLKARDAQVSFAVTSITYEAMHGLRSFQNRPYEGARVIAGLYYNPNQIVARRDSGITRLADIRGKRFSPGAPGGTTEVETRIHMAAAGLKYPQDIRPVHEGFGESVNLMRSRQLDGAWVMAALPTEAVSEMLATANARLIPLDRNLISRLQAEYPWYAEYTIPAGTYAGQDEEIRTTAIKMLLLTDVTMPDALIYQLTSVLWEHIEELTSAYPSMDGLTPQAAVMDLSDIPLHPGAERYYREKNNLQ